MRKTTAKPRHRQEPVVLAIDIGGSHVKVMTSDGNEERRAESGRHMTAANMVAAVRKLVRGWNYDVVGMGYPGPVLHHRPLMEPANLGPHWVGFDFRRSFGVPVKIVNDALMQAVGSYQGGRMLFLGLGTGLGAAMIVDHAAQPMELAHLPYRNGKTFEDYVGERGLEKRGRKKWQAAVFDVIDRLRQAMQPDYVVIGGGNVERLGKLPQDCRRGDNTLAFKGGFRLWQDKSLIL